jgi:hypothetical protein
VFLEKKSSITRDARPTKLLFELTSYNHSTFQRGPDAMQCSKWRVTRTADGRGTVHRQLASSDDSAGVAKCTVVAPVTTALCTVFSIAGGVAVVPSARPLPAITVLSPALHKAAPRASRCLRGACTADTVVRARGGVHVGAATQARLYSIDNWLLPMLPCM